MEKIIAQIKENLTPDLLYGDKYDSDNPLKGFCYVASEALYHLLGGKKSGLTVYRCKIEEENHWFLKKDTSIIDITAEQYLIVGKIIPYETAKRVGFLTREPSKRSKKLIDKIS